MHLVMGRSGLVPAGATSAPARPRPRPATRPRRGEPDGPRSGGATRALPVYLASVLAGVVLAIAWLLPGTGAGAVLAWVAALLLVAAVRARRELLPAYCAGLIGHLVGFYWVYRTVCVFGGFGPAAGALIFAVFIALGALQFLVFALIHHHLGPGFDALALRSATAVVLAELLTIRLFPWHFGHTQIAFTPFVQVAGIGGAMAVSFLMFWVAEAGVRVLVFREWRVAFLLPLVVFGLAIGYGLAMIGRYRSPDGRAQEVVVVQGNATLAEKRDLDSARKNLTRIWELSRTAAHPGSLVVWPEGSVPAYIPAAVARVGNPPVLPWIGDGTAFLVGSYSFLPNQERYNAAFAVYPDGRVPLPYFKRILIPFGETLPLASYFPWLKGLNAKAGVFSAGTETRIFDYPMRRPDGAVWTLKVAPLICYEDTVPSLA
ncbi:MAG TPA: apolipoprotein N-acyltransferase, partial [Isosphaeraceae bacterium]|nr:apolipoprotein N-acyltransferase [Isosphaeraceae bacterium]